MEVIFDGVLPIDGEIIVVEDEVTLCELTADILSEIGAKCVAFTNADDALVYLLQSHAKCALVIVDHGLPGQIQGAELVDMIGVKWPAIPAIITSGWTAEFLNLPADTRFLQKPWSIEGLVTTVAELLQPGIPVTKISPHPSEQH